MIDLDDMGSTDGSDQQDIEVLSVYDEDEDQLDGDVAASMSDINEADAVNTWNLATQQLRSLTTPYQSKKRARRYTKTKLTNDLRIDAGDTNNVVDAADMHLCPQQPHLKTKISQSIVATSSHKPTSIIVDSDIERELAIQQIMSLPKKRKGRPKSKSKPQIVHNSDCRQQRLLDDKISNFVIAKSSPHQVTVIWDRHTERNLAMQQMEILTELGRGPQKKCKQNIDERRKPVKRDSIVAISPQRQSSVILDSQTEIMPNGRSKEISKNVTETSCPQQRLLQMELAIKQINSLPKTPKGRPKKKSKIVIDTACTQQQTPTERADAANLDIRISDSITETVTGFDAEEGGNAVSENTKPNHDQKIRQYTSNDLDELEIIKNEQELLIDVSDVDVEIDTAFIGENTCDFAVVKSLNEATIVQNPDTIMLNDDNGQGIIHNTDEVEFIEMELEFLIDVSDDHANLESKPIDIRTEAVDNNVQASDGEMDIGSIATASQQQAPVILNGMELAASQMANITYMRKCRSSKKRKIVYAQKTRSTPQQSYVILNEDTDMELAIKKITPMRKCKKPKKRKNASKTTRRVKCVDKSTSTREYADELRSCCCYDDQMDNRIIEITNDDTVVDGNGEKSCEPVVISPLKQLPGRVVGMQLNTNLEKDKINGHDRTNVAFESENIRTDQEVKLVNYNNNDGDTDNNVEVPTTRESSNIQQKPQQCEEMAFGTTHEEAENQTEVIQVLSVHDKDVDLSTSVVGNHFVDQNEMDRALRQLQSLDTQSQMIADQSNQAACNQQLIQTMRHKLSQKLGQQPIPQNAGTFELPNDLIIAAFDDDPDDIIKSEQELIIDDSFSDQYSSNAPIVNYAHENGTNGGSIVVTSPLYEEAVDLDRHANMLTNTNTTHNTHHGQVTNNTADEWNTIEFEIEVMDASDASDNDDDLDNSMLAMSDAVATSSHQRVPCTLDRNAEMELARQQIMSLTPRAKGRPRKERKIANKTVDHQQRLQKKPPSNKTSSNSITVTGRQSGQQTRSNTTSKWIIDDE